MRIYSVGNCKEKQTVSAVGVMICIPHFLEYSTFRRDTGMIVIAEAGLNKTVYYKLIFLTILDPMIK